MARRSEESELIPVSIALPLELVERFVADAWVDGQPREAERLSLAKQILAARRRREKLLPGIPFGEASWDMILDLYVATGEGQKVDVSGLCLASAVAPTTAIRYVEKLIDGGYVTRDPDKHDGRRFYMHMQPVLRDAIETWLDGELAALKLKTLFGGASPVRNDTQAG